jgi:hypothetical protein
MHPTRIKIVLGNWKQDGGCAKYFVANQEGIVFIYELRMEYKII